MTVCICIIVRTSEPTPQKCYRLAFILFHGLLCLARCITFAFGSPLIMLFLAFRQTDFKFDASALEVHVQRHQGVTGALHFNNQFADFCCVQQQFAGAHRVGEDVRGCGDERADVGAEQVQRAVFDDDVGFLEVGASGSNGLDFPALQYESGFVAIFDEVVVKGFFILDDAQDSG